MNKHLDIVVQGKVQGVYYRHSTKAVADQLGIRGFIMNQDNGDVFIAAEADAMMLEIFLDWCNKGPEAARVSAVTTTDGELKNYRNFEVVKKSPAA
ncbi:acylphosphatase [Mucilaginibacter polytrichastri]|uniref:acylphosphatase n=1 Tax=Mucilaginibacter polytrichastri TaxID=1302689 RepID=A0A1Q6A692_9SPHI|nr:acylphosphatase [Mucilaginibacter polytrichastri]OKS89519.1 Acylphosphatase [Mucilaginibacter polytrichastri]SFS70994.1 acylphosphatase [Mucilaginibacter polytrichastri]